MKNAIYLAVIGLTLGRQAFAADMPDTSAFPAPQAGVDTKAPLAGANSFTEDQAQARIEEAGFTAVSQLKLDEDGIWHARATQNDIVHILALDYRGNVVVLK